jgi:hypothetical protein
MMSGVTLWAEQIGCSCSHYSVVWQQVFLLGLAEAEGAISIHAYTLCTPNDRNISSLHHKADIVM